MPIALRKAFEKWWPEFEAEIDKITSAQEPSEPRRDQVEMLEEILNTVRSLSKTASQDLLGLLRGPSLWGRRFGDIPLRLAKARATLEVYLTHQHPEIRELLLTAAFTYADGTLVFTFPPEHRDVFDVLSGVPHILWLEEAAREAKSKVKLISGTEEVVAG
jgi:hypothetical protein